MVHSSNSPSKPKGMRWDTLTIKLAVALAVKCKAKAMRLWRLLPGYHMADMNTNPIDTKNLELCWKEIQNMKIRGLFGLHWDEMDIRDGIRLCKRIGKLIGLENLKAHLHPNGLVTVCYCFQMVLLFFSRSDWLPEYTSERENRHVCSKQIGVAIAHRFTLGIWPKLRPQFAHLWASMEDIYSPKRWSYL